MRILFVVAILKHGRGGHVHSLNHISREVAKDHSVNIITIGPQSSSVLEGNPWFLRRINFNGIYRKELKIFLKESLGSYDVVHFFDDLAFDVCKLYINPIKNLVVLNRCGGPNPKRASFAHNIILFSQENLEWYHNRSKFNKSNISLIPNRVRKLSVDFTRKRNGNSFNFMRICRIGSVYEKSIKDSIALIKNLVDSGHSRIKLFIVGFIEEIEVYEECKLFAKDLPVQFLTEEKYTTEASSMLFLADAVIGTGRGLMEASSLDLPVLTIDSQGDIPVLLDDMAFEDAFKTNFSQRNLFSESVKKGNFNKIEKLITESTYYSMLSDTSRAFYLDYFDLQKAREKYSKYYLSGIKNSLNFKDWSVGNILIAHLKFYRASLKKSS